MLAIVTAAVLVAVPDPGTVPALHVRTEADALLPCPAGAALAAAVRRRLPEVAVATEGPLGGDDLLASVVRDGPGWRLYVARPTGEVAVTRVFRLRRTDCDEIGDASALILDRFLVELAWPGRAAGIEPLPPWGPSPQGPIDVSPGGAQPFAKPAAAAPEPVLGRIAISAGAAVRLSLPLDGAGGLGLDASVRLHQRWRASVWALLGPSRDRAVVVRDRLRGSLHTQAGMVAVTGAACRDRERISLCGGALAGGALLFAGATGSLYDKRDAWSILPVAGGYGRAALAFPSGFEIAAEAAVVVHLGRARFEVAGVSESIVDSPLVDGLVGVRIGWVLAD